MTRPPTTRADRRPDPGTGAALVPERPGLAPGVRLVGRQRDGGFEEQQWLVERGDRFLQVSELIYRVLEYLDGRRTLEEIATQVTNASRWTVTADHVQQLVTVKLAPLGLVAGIGAAAPNSIPADERGRLSPLAVNLRLRVLGPGLIEPVTRRLQRLYLPAVMIPILIAVVIAHGFLYAGGGVGPGVTEVLRHPFLSIAVVAIFVATAALHELGHASALRYGGGHVRGIGVGVYLIYPIFFTDTTDAYRLGRWSRVRVDLGGFYFHLVAAATLVVVAALTGASWLLVAVVVIDMEVLRQLLFPFVRLDGYWLFADLTGIPDLFSRFRPFLSSLLRGGRRADSRLPALKPAVTRVFAGYVAITIVVLSVLLVEAATRAPGVLDTARRSLLVQKMALTTLLERSDLPGALAAGLQMAILLAPLLGAAAMGALLVGQLAKAVFRRAGSRSLWRAPPRRS